MRPAALLTRLALGWVGLGLLATLGPPWTAAWVGLGALAALVAWVDAHGLRRRSAIELRRSAPDAFALDAWSVVELELERPAGRAERLELHDELPAGGEAPGMPLLVELPAVGVGRLEYRLRLRRRGDGRFGRVQLLRRSRLRLWHAREWAGEGAQVRVFPDFAPVARLALLATERRESHMGVRRRPRRGAGMSFHQLREYRREDQLRQIDWKASARRGELISREYEEERDQQVVFLLDCGRRMRALDGELSQLDHALRALLLLAWVALRQGDHVGLLAFGGRERYLPPVRGARRMGALLEALYDLEPTAEPPDYGEAAARLLAVQPRRCLAVLVTNLRGGDADELAPAIATLRRRHLVLVASLREHSIDELAEATPRDHAGALAAASAALYLEDRRRALEGVRAQRALALDVRAQDLPAALVGRYLDIKQAGAL